MGCKARNNLVWMIGEINEHVLCMAIQSYLLFFLQNLRRRIKVMVIYDDAKMDTYVRCSRENGTEEVAICNSSIRIGIIVHFYRSFSLCELSWKLEMEGKRAFSSKVQRKLHLFTALT